MNFDNLVEDAEKHGALVRKDVNDKRLVDMFEDELKALITQYVNQALAQGQEPVAKFAMHGASITSFEYLSGADSLPIGEHLLFTRAQPTEADEAARPAPPAQTAQPTPAQIALENRRFTVDDWSDGRIAIQDQNFDFDAALEVTGDFGDAKRAYAEMICAKLNEGEPL